MINQRYNPKERIPFRLMGYLNNEEILDDFQVYPGKIEYINLMADLVSLCFNVKVCMWTYTEKAGLKMVNFANQKSKTINIARFKNIYFLSLEEMTAEPVQEAAIECKVEEKNTPEDDVMRLLEETAPNTVDVSPIKLESSPLVNKILRMSIDSQDSNCSEISENSFSNEDANEETCEVKSQSSLTQLVQEKNKAGSSNSDLDTAYTFGSLEETAANKGVFNILSYLEDDFKINKAFEVTQDERAYFDYAPAQNFYAQQEIFSPCSPLGGQDYAMSEPIVFDAPYNQYEANMFPQNLPYMNETTMNVNIPVCQQQAQPMFTNAEETQQQKVKREIIDLSCKRFTGVLKFYNETKGFGFVGCEQDGTEIFLHGDDLLKANIDIKNLKKRSVTGVIRFSFSILEYMGKYNRSKKVVDLKLIEFA